MNVKHWALFFLVTLSANYVTATFLPFLGGRHRTRERGSGVRWNNCNKRLYGFLRTNIDVFSRKFQSKYGDRCNLGETESDEYTLTNVKAKGFADFSFGDTCRYYVRDGRGSLSFAISFEKIITSFVLGFPGAAGGIIGDFAETIFGIIGHFVDKLLQIIFPSFLCDIVLEVDYKEGFRLSQFNVRRPEGGLRCLGGLAGHDDILSSYLFDILFSFINKFLVGHLQPFFVSGIGKWNYDTKFLAELGLDLGGGSDEGIALGGSGSDGDLGDDELVGGGKGETRKGSRRSGKRDEDSGEKEMGGGGNGESRKGSRKLDHGKKRKSRKGSKELGLGGNGKSRKGSKELGLGGDRKSRKGSKELGLGGDGKSRNGGYRKSGRGNRDSGNKGSRWGNRKSGDGGNDGSNSGNGDGEYEGSGDLESSDGGSSSSYSSEYSSEYTYDNEDDEEYYEEDEEEYED